jgi:hypothetical protein
MVLRAHLINEVLAMVVAQLLCSNYAVEVCFHKLLHKIDFIEILDTGRLKDVQDGYDIFVVKVTEKLDFSQRPKTEHGMVEGSDPFNGNLSLAWNMDGRA